MALCSDKLSQDNLCELLEELTSRYNTPDFVPSDPISIPHRFTDPVDIELAGFLVSIIAWGNRRMILRSCDRLMQRLDNSPAQFIAGASDAEIRAAVDGFVHRTFNSVDLYYIIYRLRFFVEQYGSLGRYFEAEYQQNQDLRVCLSDFRRDFFDPSAQARTLRHVSSIDKGSACKRLCMFLRWMVRCDGCGVDFGLWRSIPASALYIPLDVHSARQGRALGLLTRKQDDWRAVEELTQALRQFDPTDPAKFDFALFGFGVNSIK